MLDHRRFVANWCDFKLFILPNLEIKHWECLSFDERMCTLIKKKKGRKDINRIKDIWNIWVSKTYSSAYFKPVPVYRPCFSSFSCWDSAILQFWYFAQGLMLSEPTAHSSPISPPLSSGGSFLPGNSLVCLPSLFLLGAHGSYRDRSFTKTVPHAMLLSLNNSKINSNRLLL